MYANFVFPLIYIEDTASLDLYIQAIYIIYNFKYDSAGS